MFNTHLSCLQSDHNFREEKILMKHKIDEQWSTAEFCCKTISYNLVHGGRSSHFQVKHANGDNIVCMHSPKRIFIFILRIECYKFTFRISVYYRDQGHACHEMMFLTICRKWHKCKMCYHALIKLRLVDYYTDTFVSGNECGMDDQISVTSVLAFHMKIYWICRISICTSPFHKSNSWYHLYLMCGTDNKHFW